VSAAVRPARILIVEDEAVVAADLQASLERLGYDVLGIADTGEEAVRMSEAYSPEVVLMDIRLKGRMDGIAAAATIRENWSIAVVFITASSSDQSLVRATSTGAYAYLLKPIRVDELNAAVVIALQQHRLAKDLLSEQTWLRNMLESVSDGVIATDAEGRVRYMNAAGEALTGVSSKEADGKPIEAVYVLATMANEPVEFCQLRKALQTQSSISKSRFLLRARSGRVIPIEDAASPILQGGRVIGAIAVFTDMSERVRTERDAEHERERLEEQVQAAAEALGSTRSDLRALSSRLMAAQEEERRRVARELHDDLGQHTAIAEFELQALASRLSPSHPEHQLVESVRRRVSDLSSTLRHVAHCLHPASVEQLGLTAALRALADEYRQQGAEVYFVAPTDIPAPPLPTATALYRIAQEALRNAVKHAEGAPVRILLKQAGEELHLKVEDAGPGFELNQVRGKGLGLLSMQERAYAARGTVLFRTAPGDGTLVFVRVPLES
jgi:PAS domain S-box-containing protein